MGVVSIVIGVSVTLEWVWPFQMCLYPGGEYQGSSRFSEHLKPVASEILEIQVAIAAYLKSSKKFRINSYIG